MSSLRKTQFLRCRRTQQLDGYFHGLSVIIDLVETIPRMHGYHIFRSFDHLHIDDGILYRKISVDGTDKQQLVLPKSQVLVVMEMVHNQIGHLGRDRTMGLLQDRFYWSGMITDVEDWIKRCRIELVCKNFFSFEMSKGGIIKQYPSDNRPLYEICSFNINPQPSGKNHGRRIIQSLCVTLLRYFLMLKKDFLI